MNTSPKLLILFSLFFMLCTASARTYYIDYTNGSDRNGGIAKTAAWKHCPGMSKFSGIYWHQAGDRFVFKGGVIWPALTLPLVIKNSGIPGSPDIFTSDSTWFSGKTWKQPVLSAQHARKQLLDANGRSFFVIDNLAFIDYGRAGIENGGKPIDINGCSDYSIRNCTIAPQSWIGLYLHSYSGLTEENIIIDRNDISAAGQAIVVAVEAPRTRIKQVLISNNAIHDLSTQIVGETHGDGIHTWNSDSKDHSQYIIDLVIRDNKFYGNFSCGDSSAKRAGNPPVLASMTSLIYLTDPGKRALISGNTLTYSAATHFSSLIWIRNFDSVAIVNNTLVMDTAQGGIGIIVGQGDAGRKVLIQNNIITNAKYCYYVYEDAILTTHINTNVCMTTGPTVAYWNLVGKTWPQWQQLGNDTKGFLGDPLFKSATDFELQQTSPGIGRADTDHAVCQNQTTIADTA